jgi:hypothetical protein
MREGVVVLVWAGSAERGVWGGEGGCVCNNRELHWYTGLRGFRNWLQWAWQQKCPLLNERVQAPPTAHLTHGSLLCFRLLHEPKRLTTFRHS